MKSECRIKERALKLNYLLIHHGGIAGFPMAFQFSSYIEPISHGGLR
jgi:hypothetical protein